jgi:hypothetical protein
VLITKNKTPKYFGVLFCEFDVFVNWSAAIYIEFAIDVSGMVANCIYTDHQLPAISWYFNPVAMRRSTSNSCPLSGSSSGWSMDDRSTSKSTACRTYPEKASSSSPA